MPDSPAPLYQHVAHPHTPRNVNVAHKAEQTQGGAIERAVAWLTAQTASTACIALFAAIGIGSLIGVFTNNALLAALCGALSSYFIQLVFLPIIQKGSAILNRHQELQAEEQYATTQHIFHDTEQHTNHLNAQDTVLQAVHASVADLHAKVDALSQPKEPQA